MKRAALLALILSACSGPPDTQPDADPGPTLPAQVTDVCSCLDVPDESARCTMFYAVVNLPAGDYQDFECGEPRPMRAYHPESVSWWWFCSSDGRSEWAWLYSDDYGAWVDSYCANREGT